MKEEITWKLETRKIKDLVSYDKNPRRITRKKFDTLEKNIKRHGFIDKPCVNVDNTIVGGHQRIRVLKRNNVKEVQAWVPNRQLTPQEIKDINIAHNIRYGEFDYDVLSSEFNGEDLLDLGMEPSELGGFDPDSIKESVEIDQNDTTVEFVLIVKKNDSITFENELDKLLEGFAGVTKSKR